MKNFKNMNKRTKVALEITGGLVVIALIAGIIAVNTNKTTKDSYDELMAKAEQVNETVNLGMVHTQGEIDEAMTTIDAKIKDLKASITNTVDTIQMDTDKFIKTNKETVDAITSDFNKGVISLVDINKYVNAVAILDDLDYIVTQDNFKPSKTNDKIKDSVKMIDDFANRAYDFTLVGIGEVDNTYEDLVASTKEKGNEITDDVTNNYKDLRKTVKSFIKDIDLSKVLSADILNTLKTFDFNAETVNSIDEMRKTINKQITAINKEVKSIKDKAAKKSKEVTGNDTTSETGSSNSSTNTGTSTPSSNGGYSNPSSGGSTGGNGGSTGSTGGSGGSSGGNGGSTGGDNSGNGGNGGYTGISAAQCAAQINSVYAANGWIIDGSTNGADYINQMIPKSTTTCAIGSGIAPSTNHGQQGYGHAVVTDAGNFYHLSFIAEFRPVSAPMPQSSKKEENMDEDTTLGTLVEA